MALGESTKITIPKAFSEFFLPFDIVKVMTLTFLNNLREVDPFIDDYLSKLGKYSKDLKYWSITSNKIFTINSFYNFLIDGGIDQSGHLEEFLL